MHTFQELLRAVTQEFATRYYIAILLRFLKILPLQPGHMGDRCSPHARDALSMARGSTAAWTHCNNGDRLIAMQAAAVLQAKTTVQLGGSL